MASAAFLLKLVLGAVGVLMAVLSLLLLQAVSNRTDAAMVSLRFYPEQTIGDFLLLLFGTVPLFIGFVLYAAGGVLDWTLLINIGRGAGILASLSVVAVLYRWWRRF